jgi:hypothetical protein
MLKRKNIIAVGGVLTGFVSRAGAAISTNGSAVYVSPDAAAGYETLQQFSLFDWLLTLLNVINYLVYIAAIIVAMYCVLIVLLSILNGKRDPKAIKDELSGQAGIIKVVKIIVYMKIALMIIDFVFYLK